MPDSWVRYLVLRLLQTIPVLFGVSVIVFIIVQAAPGDPVINMLGIQATEENIAELRQQHGLDQPIYIQYFVWLEGVLQGDMGQSLTRSESVAELVVSRLPATLFLALSSMIIALLIAIPAGIMSALHKGTATDYSVSVAALVGVSIPNFWLGLILIYFLAVQFGLMPTGNYVSPREDPLGAVRHVFLPALTIGAAYAAVLARQTRSALLDNLNEDNVLMAKSKGISSRTVLTRHVMKQSLLPVLTVAGLQFGYLLSATVVVEEIFAWPGLGRLIFEAVLQQDYPTVQGAVLVVAVLFVLINLLVDILYSFFDPRVSAQ